MEAVHFLPDALVKDQPLAMGIFAEWWDSEALGVAVANAEGVIETCNNQFASILGGRAPSQIEGKHFRDFTHPDDIATDEAMVEQVLRGERRGFSMNKRYLAGDSVIWVRLFVSAVRKPDGTVKVFFAQVLPLEAPTEHVEPSAPKPMPAATIIAILGIICGAVVLVVGGLTQNTSLTSIGAVLATGAGGSAIYSERTSAGANK